MILSIGFLFIKTICPLTVVSFTFVENEEEAICLYMKESKINLWTKQNISCTQTFAQLIVFDTFIKNTDKFCDVLDFT